MKNACAGPDLRERRNDFGVQQGYVPKIVTQNPIKWNVGNDAMIFQTSSGAKTAAWFSCRYSRIFYATIRDYSVHGLLPCRTE